MRAYLHGSIAFVGALAVSALAHAQSPTDRPWLSNDAVLVLDPYEDNGIDWDQLAKDKQVKAIINRAFFGLRPDKKYEERTAEAKKRGYSVGIYLLGRPGDPIAQADRLIEAGERLGVKFLALDIENMEPSKSMTIPDAAKFIQRVKDKTGRYPAFYTNFSTYTFVSKHFGADSVFAKTPLWLARFGRRIGMNNFNVWKDYTLWQFQSEINCKPKQTCFRRVPGAAFDMDVDVFRGNETELRTLFGDDKE